MIRFMALLAVALLAGCTDAPVQPIENEAAPTGVAAPESTERRFEVTTSSPGGVPSQCAAGYCVILGGPEPETVTIAMEANDTVTAVHATLSSSDIWPASEYELSISCRLEARADGCEAPAATVTGALPLTLVAEDLGFPTGAALFFTIDYVDVLDPATGGTMVESLRLDGVATVLVPGSATG